MGTTDAPSIYRALRQDLVPQYSLRDLERDTGISRGMLSLMEQGRLTPTVDQARAILGVLEHERRARER